MRLKYIGDTETELNIRLDNRRKDVSKSKTTAASSNVLSTPLYFLRFYSVFKMKKGKFSTCQN